MENCPFCDRNEEERIFQTTNFYVTPSLGQLVEGYLLICTKKHLLSMSYLPPELLSELEQIKERARTLLSKEYSPPIFFEHGVTAQNKKICCVEHAHIHAVPLEFDIFNDLKHLNPTRADSMGNILNLQSNYLFYENQAQEKFIINTPEVFPSQYVRQVISNRLNIPEKWNWRSHPENERFNRTLLKLKKEPAGRITDWLKEINNLAYKERFEYVDDKLKNQEALRESNLPVPDFISSRINNLDMLKLKDFFKKYSGIFVRVIPSKEGVERGLKKKFIFGEISLQECLDFIDQAEKTDKSYYYAEIQEWEPDKYGWIIISKGDSLIGEISENLDKLAHYNGAPLSSVKIEVDEFGKKKILWLRKEELSSQVLLSAINLLEDKKGEEGNFYRKGYFEGTVWKSGKIKFFDLKKNKLYLY